MNKYRILIIDDDPDILSLLENYLREEYETICYPNPILALKHIDYIDPDLCIIDIMMPLMDGREVVRKIREKPKFIHTPTIFLSVLTERKVIIDSYKAGGDLYLTKPLSGDRFLNSVKAFLKRKVIPFKKKRFNFSQVMKIRDEALEELQPEADAADQQATGKPSGKSEGTPSLPKGDRPLPRLLVADDHLDLLELITLSLSDKYELFTVGDGLSLIREAEFIEPDVFVINATLPRLSGFQGCQVLRKSSKFNRTPIILTTAKTTLKDVEYIRKHQVNAFIPKPYDIHQLDHIIHKIITDPHFRIRTKKHSYEEIVKLKEIEKDRNEEKEKLRGHTKTKTKIEDFLRQNT